MRAVVFSSLSATDLLSSMKDLFSTGDYGAIFAGHAGATQIISAIPNTGAGAYTNRPIRIRFDLTPNGKELSYVQVVNTEDGRVVQGARSQFFISVPLNAVAESGDLTFKLVAVFKDGTKVEQVLSPVRVEWNGDLAFDPVTVLGEATWKALTPAQQAAVKSELDFGRVDSEKSRAVLQWLVDNFLSSSSTEVHKMTYDALADQWKGTGYTEIQDGFNVGECKTWLQKIVVNLATGSPLPSNAQDVNAYEWSKSDLVTPLISSATSTLTSAFTSTVTHLQAGDMIQMATSDGSVSQHTVVIGKIDSDGIWVFDSNAVQSETPAYHKYLFSSLEKYDLFTIYRLN